MFFALLTLIFGGDGPTLLDLLVGVCSGAPDPARGVLAQGRFWLKALTSVRSLRVPNRFARRKNLERSLAFSKLAFLLLVCAFRCDALAYGLDDAVRSFSEIGWNYIWICFGRRSIFFLQPRLAAHHGPGQSSRALGDLQGPHRR